MIPFAQRPALDLTQVAWAHQHGDITVFGTWFGENLRPCIAIVPTYRSRSGFKPAVILVDDAFLWSAEFGNPGYVAMQAPQIVNSLGFDVTPQQCARIANLIQDHMSDLLTIPPKPIERVVVADAILTDQNGRQRHTEIKDHA